MAAQGLRIKCNVIYRELLVLKHNFALSIQLLWAEISELEQGDCHKEVF